MRSRNALDERQALRLVPAKRDVEPATRQRAALRGQDIAGNEAAERSYSKAGFAFAEEKCDASFEALTGSPGFRRFTRAM